MNHQRNLLKSEQGNRLTAREAGYLEFPGSKKDADCRKVQVPSGVASVGGCCNKFEWADVSSKEFRCGNCEYEEKGVVNA